MRVYSHLVFFFVYGYELCEAILTIAPSNILLSTFVDGRSGCRGGSRGGGGSGIRNPPPFFGGTPKLHKEGKKTSRACARMGRILVVNSYGTPPPFQNPVSAPGVAMYTYHTMALKPGSQR